ncbi:MAG: UvrD-helicase domain-containing protein [Pyrinomonadaceae bacterium]
MNEQRFLAADKALLIAPAGFGKTHFISQAVSTLNSKQLILTHTHAGVASIKQKLSENGVSKDLYQVETISSFAQRFTLAYYTGDDTPDQLAKNYFPFVIEKATELFSRGLIAKVVTNTYAGLFVDEYQDCTESQHNFINKLSNLIPTRLLGDHLQGIFDFTEEPLVNLQCPEQMAGFIDTVETLDQTPWRWSNAGRDDLGSVMISIREKLEAKQPIDLTDFPAIESVICDENDLLNWQSSYGKRIKALWNEKNLLVIHPRSDSPNFRLAVTRAYLNAFHLIEAIDDSDFYDLARQLDTARHENFIEVVQNVMRRIANKSELSNWIRDGRAVKKRVEKLKDWERGRYETLFSERAHFEESPSINSLRRFIVAVRNLPNIKCYRGEIFGSLIHSMTDASDEGISIEEAMVNNRNKIRRVGRKISGRCIGTTLLTKGLEFDTVAILNAQTFNCPKHFYVAISRASRRLIVFSNSSVLNPY